jgi:DNA-binding FrmR family transcriptional regulator
MIRLTIFLTLVSTVASSLDADALLSANNQRLAALNTRLNAVKGRINAIKADQANLAAKATAAQNAVNAASGAVAPSINSALDSNNKANAILRQYVASLESRVNNLDKLYHARNKYPWTQCSWWSINDGRESGTRVIRCKFKKVGGAETMLRVTYNGDTRSIVHGGGNRWTLRIDGSNCATPGGTITSRHHNNWNPNRHRPETLSGFCHATTSGVIGAGDHWLDLYVDYGNDAYTGWASTARMIIQEYPVDLIEPSV